MRLSALCAARVSPYAVSQASRPICSSRSARRCLSRGGTHEIADVRLTHYVSADKALSALQEASVADLMVKDCRYIEPKLLLLQLRFP